MPCMGEDRGQAARRMDAALKMAMELSRLVQEPLPVTEAEREMDNIDDALEVVRRKLIRARRLLVSVGTEPEAAA